LILLEAQTKKALHSYHLFNQCISTISVFELSNGATTIEKQQDISKIFESLEIIDFDYATAQKASEIYRYLKHQNQLIEFRDILISATALIRQIKIATKNTKHFQRPM
jgi:predicted nucleic acid-binding protein